MNAAMTYNTAIFNPARANGHSFLSALRRFFNAMLETNVETDYGLPVVMAGRLYL
ncbi:MAG: hypothetical protein Q4C10_16000 [Clostridia bacterium]|nr:hypothetical protein [Clostridia bacterium]